MFEYWANVTNVVDGDTLDLEIDLGFGISIKVRARLAGVNTPEKFGVKSGSPEWEKGVAATEFVKAWLTQRQNKVVIQSHDGWNKQIETGKYGRWVMQIFPGPIPPDGDVFDTLNETLVKAGHAERVAY